MIAVELPTVQELAHTLGPFAAFVIATFDRSGLPLIVGSVCVAVGAAGGHLVPTVSCASAGMIVGDLVLYEVGRRGGPRSELLRRLLRPLLPLRATARALLRRYPVMALAFGRYVAGAGILLPLLAGAAKIERRRAWAVLILGSLAYVIPWGTAAFLLGQSFIETMQSMSSHIAWGAVAGLVIVIAVFAYIRVRRRARKASNGLANGGPPINPS